MSLQEAFCLRRYLLIMIHLPLIDKHAAVLWDVVAVQHCVPGRAGERKDSESMGSKKVLLYPQGTISLLLILLKQGCGPKRWLYEGQLHCP